MDRPHEDNAPGPFYVCDGCCTACDIPFADAPDMFAYDDQYHCYVKRQPETENELSRMIRTMLSAELECIRYRGHDREVLRRLVEGGSAHLSDNSALGIKPASRNHVSFDAIDPIDRLLGEFDIVEALKSYLSTFNSEHFPSKFTPTLTDGAKASFSFSWYENDFHKVEISFIGQSEARWLIVTDAPFQVHDWLVSDARFSQIRWYTENQWMKSRKWQNTPW